MNRPLSLPLALPWAAPSPLTPSSPPAAQCTEGDWFSRVCHLYDLALHDGQLYFIAAAAGGKRSLEAPALPTARLNEFYTGPEDPIATDIPALVRVVTRRELAAATAEEEVTSVVRLERGLAVHAQHLRNW